MTRSAGRHDRCCRDLHHARLRLLLRRQIAADPQEGDASPNSTSPRTRPARGDVSSAPARARPSRRSSSAEPMSAAATISMRSTAKASSTRMLARREGRLMSDDMDLHRRDGADAHRPDARAEPRAGARADPRGGGQRRRLRADARSQQHDAAEPQGAVRASRERRGRHLAEGLSRARGGTEYPPPCRLAGAARSRRRRRSTARS